MSPLKETSKNRKYRGLEDGKFTKLGIDKVTASHKMAHACCLGLFHRAPTPGSQISHKEYANAPHQPPLEDKTCRLRKDALYVLMADLRYERHKKAGEDLGEHSIPTNAKERGEEIR